MNRLKEIFRELFQLDTAAKGFASLDGLFKRLMAGGER
jgi:hypothetical protein